MLCCGLVVSDAAKWDAAGCGGAEYARCNGIPVVVFPKSKSAPEGVSTDELLNVLRSVLLIPSNGCDLSFCSLYF
jgi:hypothetical protein